MKQKIIDEFGYFAEYAENQAGVKGDLIWETDFEELAERIVKLFAIPDVSNLCCSCCGAEMKCIEHVLGLKSIKTKAGSM